MTLSAIKMTLPVLLLMSMTLQAGSLDLNGFRFNQDEANIPLDEIHSGGPPKGGIPAIDQPRFIAASDAGFVSDDSRVLGLVERGIAKAYPIDIMNWHEIVNDRFAGEPVVITYCPLCGSGVAFSAMIAGKAATFGVSGLLYNSDVLLYDRETETLWSQILGRAVAGPLQGTPLKMLPLVESTWGEWRSENTNSLLLSRETGFRRDYDRDPYAGYQDSDGVWFPVAKKDPRFHPKERVLGVTYGGQARAYPFSELSRLKGELQDSLGGKRFTIRYDVRNETARLIEREDEDIKAIQSFWFAWYAFHPKTEVFRAQ